MKQKDASNRKTEGGAIPPMTTPSVYFMILENEGLRGWDIKFDTGGGLCVHNHKQIWLDEYPSSLTLFLHEVAHALVSDPETNETMGDKTGHHSIWGDKYTELVKKYIELGGAEELYGRKVLLIPNVSFGV